MQSGDAITSSDIEPEGEYPVYGGNGPRGFTDRCNTTGSTVVVGRQGALCGNVHITTEQAWVSEHALRCFPQKKLDTTWLAYALQELDLNKYSVSAAQPGLSVENLKGLRVLFPPLETQRRIARFLDEKTARIDALVAKKRALLERLAEERQALITQAVTKGLDPTVPMKDSGIDWLGQIPAHWDVKRLRFVVRLASGATPSTTTAEYWDGGIPWISPKDVKRDLLRDSQDHVTDLAVSECGLKLFSKPDVVLVVRGMILARYVPVAVATGTYTINQDIKVLESKGKIEPVYLQMYLASINSYLMTLVAEAGHGTKALRTDVLLDSPVLLPPIDEQGRIASSMEAAKQCLDEAMAKLAGSVAALVKYRAALITAAVTGQLEIPADGQHDRPDERLGTLATEVA